MSKHITIKALVLTFCVILIQSAFIFGQDNNVGIGTTTPHPDAILEMTSDNGTKGLIVPRMNTIQRQLLVPTVQSDGLLVYDTDLDQFCYWDENDAQWVCIGGLGNFGPTGPTGPAGPTGANGLPGVDGPTGPAGADGPTGPAGPAGADGATGPIGPIGPAGADGATGPAGADGATGPAGADGATGPAGADGATGPAGADGATGPAGADGATGADGADGATGPTGPAGPIDQVTGGVNNFAFVSSTALVWELASTITVTTHGNNVLVSASGWSTVFADWIGYRIVRDGTVILTGSLPDAYLISGAQDDWGFGINGLDVAVPAGSHTYTFEVAVSDVPTFNGVNEGFFQVAEINE